MRRKLFTAVSALSLLLCITAVALWVQSIGRATSTGYVRDESCVGVESIDGLVDVECAWDSPVRAGPPHWFYSGRIRGHVPSLFQFQLGRTKAPPDGNWRFGSRRIIIAAIPCWFLVALTAVLPMCWLRPRLRRRLRTRSGYCPACGYNLTANTTGICSECGATVSEAGVRRDRRARRAVVAMFAIPVLLLLPFAGRTTLEHVRDYLDYRKRLAVQQQCLDYTAPADRIAYTEDPALGRRLLAGDPNYLAIGDCVCYTPAAVREGIAGVLIGANGGPPLFLHARRTARGPVRLVVVAPISVDDAEDLRADVIIPASGAERMPRRAAESQLVIARPFGKHFTFLAGQRDPADSSHFTIAYSIDNRPGTIDGWLLDSGGVKMQVRDGPAKTLAASTTTAQFKSSWRAGGVARAPSRAATRAANPPG